MIASRWIGCATSFASVRWARSRLIASNPSTRPIRGPKKATNWTSEKSVPVEVNSIRKTRAGLVRPSSSFRRPAPVMNAMMRLIMRITVRSSVKRTLLKWSSSSFR